MEQFLQQTGQVGKYILLGVSITAAIVGICALVLLSWVSIITSIGGMTNAALYREVKSGLDSLPKQTDFRKNILILGVDSVANREGDPVLTDTIMVVSINFKTGKVSLLSFPRDLWSEKYLTKINALYVYGDQFYPGQPEKLTAEVVSELSGLPIHHTFVVSLDMVAQLIDTVGGVEVAIPESFTDSQFPRSDVPIDSTDPAILYETVTFEQGTEVLSSARALQYIRSRKSASEEQGTDLARSQRQQQVITALFKKITSPAVLTNNKVLGQLLLWYQTHFAGEMALSEAVATARYLLPYILGRSQSIQVESYSLSVYPDTTAGVIEHPNPRLYQNNWVYIVRDLVALQAEIKTYLE